MEEKTNKNMNIQGIRVKGTHTINKEENKTIDYEATITGSECRVKFPILDELVQLGLKMNVTDVNEDYFTYNVMYEDYDDTKLIFKIEDRDGEYFSFYSFSRAVDYAHNIICGEITKEYQQIGLDAFYKMPNDLKTYIKFKTANNNERKNILNEYKIENRPFKLLGIILKD